MAANVNSLGALLNFEELIKVKDDSWDVAEEEDADNADQDRGKVHLLTISGFFPSWAAYKTASLLDGSKVRFLKIS